MEESAAVLGAAAGFAAYGKTDAAIARPFAAGFLSFGWILLQWMLCLVCAFALQPPLKKSGRAVAVCFILIGGLQLALFFDVFRPLMQTEGWLRTSLGFAMGSISPRSNISFGLALLMSGIRSFLPERNRG